MYIVEGNIGAGKSTFLKLIEQQLPHISVALEPLHNWQSTIYSQSLLTNFYQEPKRWAYTLETLTMMCRVREHLALQAESNRNKIVERSIYSGHYCFAQNSFENGYLTTLEWNMYNQWFNLLIPDKCKAPLGFIYLRVDPEIAYERIKKRNRLAEKTMTLSYLKQIHARHEAFLLQDKKTLPLVSITPVLVLECNEEFETNPTMIAQHFQRVATFMAHTQQSFKPAKMDTSLMRHAHESVDIEFDNI